MVGGPLNAPWDTYIQRAIYSPDQSRGGRNPGLHRPLSAQRTPDVLEVVDLPARQGVGDYNDS